MQIFENTLWSGKCLSGEMSIREVSAAKVSVEDLSSGKVSVGEVSGPEIVLQSFRLLTNMNLIACCLLMQITILHATKKTGFFILNTVSLHNLKSYYSQNICKVVFIPSCDHEITISAKLQV